MVNINRLAAFTMFFILIPLSISFAQTDGWVNIYFGKLDSTAIEANINAPLDIDVYIQTSPSTYMADAHISLGVDNRYIESLLSADKGEILSPFSEWDVKSFLPPQGAPPNPKGWSSQSFIGFARMVPPYKSPLLHFDEPTLALKFAVKTVDDQSLIGQTIDCLGPGLNQAQGPSNAGDTTGMISYNVNQQFSPVHFADSKDK
jgi:hypothetical protein